MIAPFAAWLVGCTSGDPAVTIDVRLDGLDVHASAPIARVDVSEGGGPATITRLPSPAEDAWIAFPPGDAADLRVHVVFADGHIVDRRTPAPRWRCDLAVTTAGSLSGRSVGQDEVVQIARLADGPIAASVEITAATDGAYTVTCGEAPASFTLRAGERRSIPVRVDDRLRCEVVCGDDTADFDIEATPIRADGPPLVLVGAAFPVGPDGTPDPAGSPDRVALPAAWWEAALKRLRLGSRPPDSQAPWASRGATVRNDTDLPLDIAVRQRILTEDGSPAPAFRPRIRDQNGGIDAVVAMARVPAHGTATVVLPVYVDRAKVAAGTYLVATDIEALGSTAPLVADRRPIYVTRGSGPASVGLAAALAAAALGWAAVALGGRRFLATARTADLTTIALFATVQLVVGVASQLFASATTTLIGPFAPIVTGLVDESLRAALLTALVTLVPRPGAVAASIGLGYLLRLLALGSFLPIDAVWLGDAILFHEVALYATGVTRDPAWRDGSPLARWVRLASALAPATAATAACAMAVHVAAFRLFYADWYVAMVLIGPSFLYMIAACAIAAPFADSLRRVAP